MKSKMTEGKIFSKLLLFALPLVIGSIFQLTYKLLTTIYWSKSPISLIIFLYFFLYYVHPTRCTTRFGVV